MELYRLWPANKKLQDIVKGTFLDINVKYDIAPSAVKWIGKHLKPELRLVESAQAKEMSMMHYTEVFEAVVTRLLEWQGTSQKVWLSKWNVLLQLKKE